jgi:pyruvate dehydrogenase E1 component
MKYLHERRAALGGYLPSRQDRSETLPVPELSAFDVLLQGTGERSMSTTMAFVRILAVLLRDKAVGPRVVPIIPDEARTFGMEGLFRQVGIYDPAGQLYEPVDADQVMWYKQAQNGQVLQEGINEAGAMSSWIAAATSYANHGVAMIPFYIYYSMFGFQRIGDLVWAAGDSQARGFMLGGTAGRTTLAGEGLQHQDGHNLIQFGQVPNCMTYDPTFAYELAVIVQDGLRRMTAEKDKVFYYVTVMNENYEHPAMPAGVEEQIIQGLYRLSEASGDGPRAQLMGSGTILREVIKAAELLSQDWGVQADVWSATSFNLLKRDGDECERWNTLHPLEHKRVPFITKQLAGSEGPVIAATDYLRAYADQVRAFIPGDFVVLGTDGYGRSDTRAQLRQFFEVNAHYVVISTLKALADRGEVPAQMVADAIARYAINADKPAPWTL